MATKKRTFWTFFDSLEGDKVVWIIALMLIMISIVCLFIPYYGRILMLLALPVPLFAWHCHIMRGRFKTKTIDACYNLETNYNRIVASIATEHSGKHDLKQMISTILDDKLKSLQTGTSTPKPKTKRKKTERTARGRGKVGWRMKRLQRSVCSRKAGFFYFKATENRRYRWLRKRAA